MKNKRGIKHYIIFYLTTVVLYFVYISILAIQSGGYDKFLLISIAYLPILFISFKVLFDTIFDSIMSKTKKQKSSDENKGFFDHITKTIDNQLKFGLEDFRRLRENPRFQKALHQAYKIYKEGETAEMNFILLSKKFKKNSRESQAMKLVIEEVKRMKTN